MAGSANLGKFRAITPSGEVPCQTLKHSFPRSVSVKAGRRSSVQALTHSGVGNAGDVGAVVAASSVAVVQYHTSSQYSVSSAWKIEQWSGLAVRAHDSRLDGASPNHSATWALAHGDVIQSIHSNMQFGFDACSDTIQVSDQPVASTGLIASIGAPLDWARLTMTCQVVPASTVSPSSAACWSVYSAQYWPTNASCCSRVDGGGELRLVEGVRIGDAEVRLGRHQVQRGVGDVDRAVVHRDCAVRSGSAVEHHAPRIQAASAKALVL